MDMYEKVEVWQRREKDLVRYVCLKSLDMDKYAVLKADFFRSSSKAGDFDDFERQFIELMIEQSPAERCSWFDSVLEAVSAHDTYFGNE
jgi:hypothetical protein